MVFWPKQKRHCLETGPLNSFLDHESDNGYHIPNLWGTKYVRNEVSHRFELDNYWQYLSVPRPQNTKTTWNHEYQLEPLNYSTTIPDGYLVAQRVLELDDYLEIQALFEKPGDYYPLRIYSSSIMHFIIKILLFSILVVPII